jgi:hypothetical protein
LKAIETRFPALFTVRSHHVRRGTQAPTFLPAASLRGAWALQRLDLQWK